MINGTVVGIDNRKFMRGTPKKFFEAALGVGIEVSNYKKFGEKYNMVLEDLFRKYEIERLLSIYNTHQIKKSFNVETPEDAEIFESFFHDFYKSIMPSVDVLHIFYTYFNRTTTPTIKIFGKDGGSEISPISFISSHLHNSYPHICAYKLLSDDPSKFNSSNIFLDDFQGCITPAWEKLKKGNNIRILIRGDSCNYCVSAADVLINSIDLKIFEKKTSLDEAGLMMALNDFSKKLKIHYIGKGFLRDIAPYTRERISKNSFYGPIVYIFDEKNPFIKKDSIESSPIMNKIFDFVAKIGGSLKYFDKTSDPFLFKTGDYIFPIGSDGEKSIEIFKNLGYPIERLIFDEK